MTRDQSKPNLNLDEDLKSPMFVINHRRINIFNKVNSGDRICRQLFITLPRSRASPDEALTESTNDATPANHGQTFRPVN